MKAALALSLLAACSPAPAPVPPQSAPEGLPAACSTKARLGRAPSDERSIPQLVQWARTAAKVANQAIQERDACALDYQRLRAACSTVAGCKIN